MDTSAKNILIVCHHYPPHITGVGMVAHNQAKHLVALGHTVTVVTSDTNSDEKSCVIDGVTVVRVKALNISERFDAPFPVFSPRLISVLARYVKKADVVHVHDAFYMSSFFAVLFAKFYRKPVVLTQHVAWVMHPSRIILFIEKIVYATTGLVVFRLSDKIYTYNDRVENFLLHKRIPKEKLARLVNGVDVDIFHPVSESEKKALRATFGLNTDKKVILFVGRFVPKKGFDKLLACSSSTYQLVFAGADSIGPDTEDVIFLGKLSQKELARAYQASDVFVLPSESEGFPLSIQEAMACGLPIVTTYDDGYVNYHLDKDLFVMLHNVTNESLRKTIEDIVIDDAKLHRMAAYSREYAEKNFVWSVSVEDLERTYTNLIQKNRTVKKIAFVSDAVYQFNKGGKEKRLYEISQRLVKRGYSVTIYCMQWWEGEKVLQRDGITLYAISPYYPLYANNRRSIKQAVCFSLHCFKLITKSFDVVDVDHIPHLVLFTTKIVSFVKRKKMIVTWHEVWGKTYWQNYLGFFAGYIAYIVEKMSALLPDQIISVSEHTTKDLRNILHVTGPIETIPNGLDFGSIQKSVPSTHTSDVVFAGRLLSHKHVDVLLEAIDVLKKKGVDVQAVIVGDGPEKENLEKLSRSLGLDHNVSFAGFFEDQIDLYALLKSSKVFVLPSSREGFGIAVIDANACGLSVVTVNAEHNASKDLIEEGENGFVCDLNPDALAHTIEKALHAKKDAKFYITYSEKYDWNNIFPAVEKVYRA